MKKQNAWVCRSVFFGILLLVLFSGSVWIHLQPVIDGPTAPDPPPLGPPPPGEPPMRRTTPEADEPAVSPAQPTGDYSLYIPLIYNPEFTDRDAAVWLYEREYRRGQAPIEWNGNVEKCQPGETSSDFKDSVLRRINYFRALAGVPLLSGFSEPANEMDQEAAMMMSANNRLSHSPPTTWKCYSQRGDEGAGSSNLYLGVYGVNAIDGYIRDPGSNNTAVGHRRWILYPNNQSIGTGDIPPNGDHAPANALGAWDDHIWDERPPTRDPFVAWPPPGYVPYEVVYPRWSFSYPGADFDNAVVQVLQNGEEIQVTKYKPEYGYGENTLVWLVHHMDDDREWPKPKQDEWYYVTIQNVIVDEERLDFSYLVVVFNPSQ